MKISLFYVALYWITKQGFILDVRNALAALGIGGEAGSAGYSLWVAFGILDSVLCLILPVLIVYSLVKVLRDNKAPKASN